MPKISVIVPVYKAEDYIVDAVNSVLSQDFSDFEMILIDDKSPDNSGKICDEFTDNRIKVIHLEKNGGPSIARNIGIKIALGEYILFFDSDDSLEPGALKYLYSKAKETDADEVIFGYNTVVEVDGKIVLSSPVFSDTSVLSNKKAIAEKMVEFKEKNLIDSICNKLYKKEMLIKSGVLMPVGEIFEDTEFNIRLLDFVNVIAVTNKCFYNYMQRSVGSITKSYNPKKIEFLKKRSQTLKEYYQKLDMFNGEIEQICNYFYIKYIFSGFIDLNFPSSGLKFGEKIKCIKAEIDDEAFKFAANNSFTNGKLGKVIIFGAKTNNAYIVYLLCLAVYVLKYKLRKLFFKIKGL